MGASRAKPTPQFDSRNTLPPVPVKQVVQETNDLVKNRMWLQANGVLVKQDAAQASVP